MAAWKALLNNAGPDGQVHLAVLNNFIQQHFEQPGGELEDHEPSDFSHENDFSAIADPQYREWAMDLHRKWPTLCRRVADKVLANPARYSLIPLPKPFVVPGGRFREMYYWDSFFTIKGLLASRMFETVRGMIENMGHLIEQFGFIPNGNRVYYLNRSQPPLLTWCVQAYYEATKDVEFLRSAMQWLEKEMDFFTQKKAIHMPGWKSTLFRFHVVATGPRPESFREDLECAEHIEDVLEKQRLWGDIAAAAESGRDFSARWFHSEGPQAGKMGSTRTSSIIPVDLNAIICGNMRLFAEFYNALGEEAKAEAAIMNYTAMRETIHDVFWCEEEGCWFDYDISCGQHLKIYFDTNFFPLYTGCVHDGFDCGRIADYLNRQGVLAFPGGVPSSLISSGQQWDFPNSWSPTTWIIIEGLRANGQPDLARGIADKWVKKNYAMWRSSGGRMFEKYNVASECVNASASGGEYELQEGFGWTNGVILDLLLTYQTELSWDESYVTSNAQCACCRPRATSISKADAAAVAAAIAVQEIVAQFVPSPEPESSLMQHMSPQALTA